MRNVRMPHVAAVAAVAAVAVLGALVLTACSGIGGANAPSSTASVTPTGAVAGSVTPTGAVRVGTWRMTVHGAQAYANGWAAPAGMPGNWGHMGRGYMAVVLDVSAQSSATPAPNASTPYAGPACTLRGGRGMMGPMMGNGYGGYNNGSDGWHMLSPGLYQGPMAYMAPTSTRQFTLVCTDAAGGQQASWDIGF